MSYFEDMSKMTGLSAIELRWASIRQRAKLLTPADCATQLRTIANTSTQLFASEKAMMLRAAEYLDELQTVPVEQCAVCGKSVTCDCYSDDGSSADGKHDEE